MNIIQAFNNTIDYIEQSLDSEIDENKIMSISTYSYAMFGRIFSVLTDYTLSEYIRLRRLTKSAVELRDTDNKIVDIAVKYGWDSSNSFTFAFKKFHNHTPTEVRNGAPFKLFTPIKLSLTVKGGNNMKVRIENKNGFKIAGLSKKSTPSSDFPKIWQDLFKKASFDDLIKLGSGISYGACFEHTNKTAFSYMAGFDVKNEDMAKQMGLEILDIPPAQYAIIKLKGKIPDSIHKGWKYVLEEFFPEQSYKHAGSPDFEVYSEGDMYSDDYVMELWVPIEKER